MAQDLPPSVSWIEPRSDYKAVYPYNNIKQTESGHSFEMDDTPGAERIRLQHRTGTFTEIQADGSEIHKVIGTNYEIIAQDNNILIKGLCNITVQGDSTFHVQGDSVMQVDGNVYQNIKGDCNQKVDGDLTEIVAGSVLLTAPGGVDIHADVSVNGDLNVTGNIVSGSSISAKTNVTAGANMYAGINITALGIVTGTIVTDLIRSIEEDRLIFDQHVHAGVKAGPNTSSPPLQVE